MFPRSATAKASANAAGCGFGIFGPGYGIFGPGYGIFGPGHGIFGPGLDLPEQTISTSPGIAGFPFSFSLSLSPFFLLVYYCRF